MNVRTQQTYVCDSNCELDNLYQDVEVIQEELEAEKEAEKEKVKNLLETIRDKKKSD